MSSNTVSPVNDKKTNFELITSVKANGVIPVHEYRSKVTGLTVFIAEVDGPMVSGHFFLATETHDEDGLPHCLEHLIFKGSEKYPYDKILERVSHRYLSSGVNACTSIDHTVYTLETAGIEGFLALLPMYVDHILNPNLTDSAFITEVHHITKDGEDAGVVYCEMEGKENVGLNLCVRALRTAMYPGNCGLKYTSGGLLNNLRESTTNEKVKKYHKEFYRSENLSIIIIGQINVNEVLEMMAVVEEDITSKGERVPFIRPWQSPISPLTESSDNEVKYPSDEEDNGIVLIAWRGPSGCEELYNYEACKYLLLYLTNNLMSPIQKLFVEQEDAYASEITYLCSNHSEPMMTLICSNVPISKMEMIKERVFEVLKDICNDNIEFSMDQMSNILDRSYLKWLGCMETSSETIVPYIIEHVLYGNSKEDLQDRLSPIDQLETMKKEPQEFWINHLKQYFANAPSVTVRGYPSIKEKNTLAEQERKRIAARKEKLGKEGLEQLGTRLEEAIAENAKDAPESLFFSLPIPDFSTLNLLTGKFYSTDSTEQHPQFDLSQVPVYMQLDDIQSNFVNLMVLMNTSGITEELRPYVLLFMDALLAVPVRIEDELVPAEVIESLLEITTIQYSANSGMSGFTNVVCLHLNIIPAKYGQSISMLRELLNQTEFTPERLRIVAAKYVNGSAEEKRDPDSVLADVMKGLLYIRNSKHYCSITLNRLKFMAAMIEKLDSGGENEVIENLESVRAVLTEPSNMVIHMTANISRLAKEVGNLSEPWKALLPPNKIPVQKKLSATPDWKLILPPDKHPNKSCIVCMGSLDTTYFMQATPSIKDMLDKDMVPLIMYIQYFTQTEGSLWNEIRGSGLAYGFSIKLKVEEALLFMSFGQTSNCIAAYEEAKNVILSPMEGEFEWNETLFEMARSYLLANTIENYRDLPSVIATSMLSHFRGQDQDYYRKLLKQFSDITTKDMNGICSKYIAPLFDPSQTKTAILCPPSKADEICNGFKNLGIDLEVYESLEESFLNSW